MTRRLINLKSIVVLTGGSATRAVLQSALLILIARNMPIETYGQLVGIVSLLTVFLPLAALGYEFELLNASSLHSDVQKAWGNFLTITLLTSLIISLILLPFTHYLFSNTISSTTILMLIFSEVFSPRVIEGACRVFQGEHKPNLITITRILFISTKLLLIALIALAFQDLTIFTYAIGCLIASTISIFISFIILKKESSLTFHLNKPKLLECLAQTYTSISYFFDKLSSNIDKVILAKTASPQETAACSIAHRIADLITIPMLSLITLSQSQYFTQKTNHINFKNLLFPPTLYLAVISPLVYFYSDPIITFTMGSQYSSCSALLNAYLFLPLTTFVKFNLTTQCIAIGARKNLVISTIFSTLINIVANILLIPNYGAFGAISALFISEAITISILIILLKKLPTKNHPTHQF